MPKIWRTDLIVVVVLLWSHERTTTSSWRHELERVGPQRDEPDVCGTGMAHWSVLGKRFPSRGRISHPPFSAFERYWIHPSNSFERDDIVKEITAYERYHDESEQDSKEISTPVNLIYSHTWPL
ncbi:hypothetical protein V1478_013962 [Vespula squamosa]|uniref:Secreted protein n=1 Tax=Vespula squamosa TaxID=30214 RepID=A0ABD2A7E1_VESSQ